MPEISRNKSFLFDSRVSFEGALNKKNLIIKPAPNSKYALINEVRLTTHEYGMYVTGAMTNANFSHHKRQISKK